MKLLLSAVTLGGAACTYAQTPVNRSIAVTPGQTIEMEFDYPELIRVSTWDGEAISIKGTVSINGGENDDAFVLEHATQGNRVKIHAGIRDMEHLPQRITLTRDGRKIMFHDEEEYRKYQAQHGRDFSSVSWGADIQIRLEIRVPRNTETRIRSVYGMVEVRDFSGPLSVDATYGGVDVALAEPSVGELTAETSFGQIYTNLDTKFAGDQLKSRDFETVVSAKPGSGPRYTFESKYGNVYLRKATGR